MALGQTDITTTIVRNILGAGINTVFGLGTYSGINRWSRFKPTTGTRPAGTSGKFGLNLPTNWNYVPITNNARLGDFRGYEHDKDIAGPTVWMVASDNQIWSSFTPYGGFVTGWWMFHMNTVTADVRIIPSDLGLQNYYWGIKLVGGGGTYYKTTNSVLSDSASIPINVNIADPEIPSYIDCPYGTGTYTWTAFLSSTSQTTWGTGVPSNIIYLPTGTFGSKTVINTGTFIITEWLTVDDNSHSYTYDASGYTTYHQDSVVGMSAGMGHWHIKSKPDWIDYRVYDETDSMDITASPTEWQHDCILKLFPNTVQVFPNPERTGFIWLGDDTTSMISIYVAQAAAPEIYSITLSTWSGDTSGLSLTNKSGWVEKGSQILHITFTPHTVPNPPTLWYRIKYHTTVVGINTISGCTDNVSKTTTITATAAANEDIYGAGISVELSGDMIS